MRTITDLVFHQIAARRGLRGWTPEVSSAITPAGTGITGTCSTTTRLGQERDHHLQAESIEEWNAAAGGAPGPLTGLQIAADLVDAEMAGAWLADGDYWVVLDFVRPADLISHLAPITQARLVCAGRLLAAAAESADYAPAAALCLAAVDETLIALPAADWVDVNRSMMPLSPLDLDEGYYTVTDLVAGWENVRARASRPAAA